MIRNSFYLIVFCCQYWVLSVVQKNNRLFLNFNKLFIPQIQLCSEMGMWMKLQLDKRDHTRNFILVHSSSRATSSHLQNYAKISLKIPSLQSNTQQRLNLEPYQIDLTLTQNPTTKRRPYCSALCKLTTKMKLQWITQPIILKHPIKV